MYGKVASPTLPVAWEDNLLIDEIADVFDLDLKRLQTTGDCKKSLRNPNHDKLKETRMSRSVGKLQAASFHPLQS